jgi:hypothetical protein
VSNPVPAIKSIPRAQQQHMLFLFVPLKSEPATAGKITAFVNAAGPDLRATTGVHFFMIHHLKAGTTPPLPVPSFTTAPGKDALIVLSIYDADFEPYISAFFADDKIVGGLNFLMAAMDETDIIKPTDTSSADYIFHNGGVAKNAQGFYKLLMRYNFADPTIPAVGPGGVANTPAPQWKYFLGTNFPGLTVGMTLKKNGGYPNAHELWPAPGLAPAIEFEPSIPPKSASKAV